MKHYNIKANVEAIHMSEEMRLRITNNIHTLEEYTVKKTYRKPLTVAAALVLCLMLPLGASAAGKLGFFRDISVWNGAIVGTAYENATEEIAVAARIENDGIAVTVTLLKPEAFPYCEEEALALGRCYLTDDAGNRIAELSETDTVKITGPTVVFRLPLKEGAHRLHIENFVGRKKADQDLTISGNWEIIIK